MINCLIYFELIFRISKINLLKAFKVKTRYKLSARNELLLSYQSHTFCNFVLFWHPIFSWLKFQILQEYKQQISLLYKQYTFTYLHYYVNYLLINYKYASAHIFINKEIFKSNYLFFKWHVDELCQYIQVYATYYNFSCSNV